MTITELARLVKSMRDAQQAYFKDRTHWNLAGARQAEKDLDAAMKEILDAEAIAAEGEKAFESGGQAWADWNMGNNPFGD